MDRTSHQKKHVLLGLCVAVMAIVVATLLAAVAQDPDFRQGIPYIFFFVAITAVAWVGGLYPALLSTLLGGVAIEWFLVEPALQVDMAGNTIAFVGYLITGSAISLIAHAMHKARKQAASRQHDIEREIAERTRIEHALRENQTDLNRAQHVAQTGSWRLDVQRNILTWSDESYLIFGIPKGTQLTYETFLNCIHPADRAYVDEQWTAALQGAPYDIEHRIVADGAVRWVRETAELDFDSNGSLLGGFGTVQDITARKQAEFERETTIEFLRFVNESRSLRDLMKSSIAFFKELSGCDAIGIRMREGDDYPYYETQGFSEAFIRDENSLCVRTEDGDVLRSSTGQPILGCICANVSCGHCDPDSPYFTNNGSFWTASTTELASSLATNSPIGHVRNRCNKEGYESVALIPLRRGPEPIGLLQLNDHRNGFFTADNIALWEQLAGYLAVALARSYAEEELKRAKAEAEEGKRILDTLMEYVPEGITIADAPGNRIRMVSRYGQEILGAQHNDIDIHDVVKKWDVYHKDGTTPMAPDELPLTRAIQYGETVQNAELVQRKSDGQLLHLSCNAAPIRDDEGKTVGGVVAWRDIGELARAQAALRESEERYRALFAGMTEGFALHEIILDSKGKPCDYRFLEINPAFERLTGFRREDVQGRFVSEILPNNDPYWIEAYGEVALTGTPRHFEQYSSPLKKWFEVVSYRPAPQQFAVIFMDVTERKQTEEALWRTTERFKLLSEVTAQLLKAEDPQAIVEKLCREIMHHLDCDCFFNFLLDENVGRLRLNACAGIPEADVAKLQWLEVGQAVCGCVAKQGSRIIAEDIQHSEDQRADLVRSYGIQAYACHPLLAQGRPIGTLSFGARNRASFAEHELELMRTVADQVSVAMQRILTQKALQESADVLKRSNQDLEQFAYVASHDLQEPLRQVSGFIGLLERNHGHQFDATAKEYFAFIKEGAVRMHSLINDLLEYSRIGRTGRTQIDVDAAAAAQYAMKNLAGRIRETDASVIIGNLPCVRANPLLLNQVFQNLLANALKFRGETKPEITINAEPQDGQWLFSVKDNGIGFPQELADRVFVIFQRLHGRGRYDGTGIGLAICKRAIQQQGGTIWAQSQPGAGTTVYFTLPTG